MAEGEVRKRIAKLQKLRALSHARERVRQLERELYDDAVWQPEEAKEVPEFLSSEYPLGVV